MQAILQYQEIMETLIFHCLLILDKWEFIFLEAHILEIVLHVTVSVS